MSGAAMNVCAFLDDPLSSALPARVAPLLAPGLRPATAARLIAAPALAAPLSRWLAEQLGRGDLATLEAADRGLALATADVLAAVALRAGAVWHAAAVCRLVHGPALAAFLEACGAEARAAAIRHRNLAMPDAAVVADLPHAVQHDGAAALAAWLAVLPDWAASRVRLRWAGDVPPPAAPGDRRAVAIVRALAP